MRIPIPERTSVGILDSAYRTQSPWRTFFLWMRCSPGDHVAIVLLYLLKFLPVLLLPVVIAESIRVASGGVENSGVYLAVMYAGFAVTLFANIPFHMLFIARISRIVRTMELHIRAALVRRLQQLSMRFHGSRESGRLHAKVLRDVEEVVRLGEIYFQHTIGAVIALLFAFATTLARDPLIALAYIVVAPIAIVLARVFRRSMGRRNEAFRREIESMSQRIGEMIAMVPVTRAHGLEEREIGTMQDRLEYVYTKGGKVDEINAIFGSAVFVIFQASTAVIVMLTTWQVMSGRITLDKIALYASLFSMVVGAINQLIAQMPQISKTLAAVRSLGEVLECDDLEINEGKRAVRAVAGRITFRDVSFTYPSASRLAVAGFSLDIAPGEAVAFVGESGSGKSTLMQLAIGFLRPQGGEVLLDGVPMEQIDMRTYRRFVAMVPQNTILFSGTVRDNITYGLDHYTEESVWAAVDAANLRSVVKDLPDGLDTPVGENGVKMSGGQRQRLAIARALIRNPRIIILDEATSALDVLSEREVQLAIERLVEDRTVLIVAHRLSTIRRATRVVVMADGRMVESGPPDELAARRGAFARLRALQTA